MEQESERMRLIDADKLIKTIQEREDAPPEWEGATFKDAFSITIMDIIAQPTIDAVPVIRCKHCPFCKSREGDFPWCKRFEVGTQDNDYCEIDSVIEDELQRDK